MTLDESHRQSARASLSAALTALEEGRDLEVLELLGDAAETVGAMVVYRMPSIERAAAGKGGRR